MRRDGSTRLFTRFVATGCLAALLGGCVTVRPSQRRHLSKPEMEAALEAEEEAFYQHVEAAREGGFGGHGGAGGGCGCG